MSTSSLCPPADKRPVGMCGELQPWLQPVGPHIWEACFKSQTDGSDDGQREALFKEHPCREEGLTYGAWWRLKLHAALH